MENPILTLNYLIQTIKVNEMNNRALLDDVCLPKIDIISTQCSNLPSFSQS